MKRARERAPDQHEAALILGMSEYTVSAMSWPVRVPAQLGGLSGNREAGLALLAEAATPGSETESDAELLLLIVDRREGRYVDGLQRLDRRAEAKAELERALRPDPRDWVRGRHLRTVGRPGACRR
jgi:hypothetical protein